MRLDIEAAPVAVGFLRTTTIPVLTCRLDTMLPARLTTTWRRAADGLPGPRRPSVKNVVQPIKGGPVEVLEVPRPVPGPTEVLVAHDRVGDLARAPSGR